MEILTAEQANNLIRLRGLYRDCDNGNEHAREMCQLLSIINSLESFNTLARKTEVCACIMVVRGYYKEAPEKLIHVLQFAVVSTEPNEEKIMQDIQTRFGSSVLRGFSIESVERYPVHEKMFLCGTGLEG